MKNALAGQIARACAVFCVDEVVVFNDGQTPIRAPERDGYTAYSDPNFFLYHVLSYLETPPHLRKALFPMHPDLRTAGALPSLDMPHHLRSNEWCPFREGVSVGVTQLNGQAATLLDCGLANKVSVRLELEPSTRLTVRVPETENGEGEAVAPDTPREEAGYYWGYSVRKAPSLGSVFTECPFDGGYDMSVGTSERGTTLSMLLESGNSSYIEPSWKHLVIVFGGVSGLEAALSTDRELQNAGVTEVKDLFDRWVNLVPGQGSRTIRTEEAVWVGLAGLRSVVEARTARAN
jgi:predicted SPOUT superfamily RNA methylase MTH1